MPKNANKIILNLDLLRPQNKPEKILFSLTRWAISSGRYLLIFVELIVLVAFVSRFKLDTDLATNKDSIEQQIPYIETLKPYEVQIRNTQLKLASLKDPAKLSPDYPAILKKISRQTPVTIRVSTLSMEKDSGKAVVQFQLVGQASSNNDVIILVNGLKSVDGFANISLANIGLEQDQLTFTITGEASTTETGEHKS